MRDKKSSHLHINILNSFIEDLTVSKSAKRHNLSRYMVNNYYQKIRYYLLNEFDKTNHLLYLKSRKKEFYLKYFQISNFLIFYIEFENIIIFENDLKYKIDKQILDSLFNHKRANCIKLTYNEESNKLNIINFYKQKSNLNEFVVSRLKKFRGINQEKIYIHLKESIIRYKKNEYNLKKIIDKIPILQ